MYYQAGKDVAKALECFKYSAGDEAAACALDNIKYEVDQARIAAGVASAVEINTHPVNTVVSKQQAFELMSETADAVSMMLPVFLGLKGSDVPPEDVEMFVHAIVNAARELEAEYL